jgi:hypothetical protein
LSTPLTVEACKTETVDIVADISTDATASAEHNIAIELPSDFQSNAKDVNGNFPLRGNTFRVATVTSGKVTVDFRTVSPDEVEVGDKSVVVGKFELSTDSVEDQTIYAMTLEQNGTISDGNITNIRIARTDGTVLTNTVASTEGDFATLTFDPPFTIIQGDKITLEVLADVVGGAGDTVQIDFEEESDIFAVGSLYGYGVNGQLYGSQVELDTDAADEVTIKAGQLTIELDGPVQQKYTRDDNDAVLANINMVAGGDPVNIRDMYVAIEGQTASGTGLGAGSDIRDVLEGVEIRNTKTGQTISAVPLNTQGTATTGDYFSNNSETWQIYRFDDFDVDGSQSWQFRVDFIDNGSTVHPMNGDTFRVHVCTEPKNTTAGTQGCDFGGLITEVETYNLVAEGATTGDDVTDVRPGGDVTGNLHRIAAPTLNVSVQGIGSADTAVKNSKNVNLFRFEARAGEAEDLLLTSAIFQADMGSLQNAQNFTLWYDSDGDSVVDTILETGVTSQGTPRTVTFNDITGGGVLLAAEESTIFEVHANIAASLTSSQLRMQFATGSTYLEAEEADNGSSLSGISTNGSSATADIVVTTALSKLYTLINQGDLFVTADSTPVRSRQLLGGTLGDSVLRLQFRAQNEDIDVTDLQLTASGTNASSIDRLELYAEGATSPFATATTSGCGSDDTPTSTFCANMESRQLVVKKGQNMDVIIRPRMKSDQQGATSGQDIELYVSQFSPVTNVTNSGAIRARGAESSNNLDANGGNATSSSGAVFIGRDTTGGANAVIRSNISDVVLSKIVSITNANPDADGKSVPTGVSAIGQFKFTAATNTNSLNGLNKATLSGVTFNIVATNVDLDGSAFKFYNKADTSTKQSCSLVGATNSSGSLVVSCMGLKASSVDTSLDSGESVTFVLEANVTNPNTGSINSTLQVSLQHFSDRAFTTYTSDSASTSGHIHWLDEDTSATDFYWIEYSETEVKSTSYQS